MAFEFAKQENAALDLSNSNTGKSKTFINNPICITKDAKIFSYNHIIKVNDLRLKPAKINLENVLRGFDDLQKMFYDNLEKGNYHVHNNLYITSSIIRNSKGVEKEIEYTFNKGNLIIYSCVVVKKDIDNNIKSYKFITFAEDGESILHSQENYVYNNQRLEIRRNADGEVTEIIEETGENVSAFHVEYPTLFMRKDSYGNVLEVKEWQYDANKRIVSYLYTDTNKYYSVENSYINDLIVSNYKNSNNQIYWNRIFNSKIGKHISEKLYDRNGNLIREEKFSYNQNGDLVLRLDKDANGNILSAKEIKYNEDNVPVLVINRGQNGVIENSEAVA